jgi:hypothetical protein
LDRRNLCIALFSNLTIHFIMLLQNSHLRKCRTFVSYSREVDQSSSTVWRILRRKI